MYSSRLAADIAAAAEPRKARQPGGNGIRYGYEKMVLAARSSYARSMPTLRRLPKLLE
jgi:hypothetical protein